MTRYVCTTCGAVKDTPRNADATSCPHCDPMQWMVRIGTPAAATPGRCHYVTPPQSDALAELGIRDTAAGKQLCTNLVAVDGLCQYHHELEHPTPRAAPPAIAVQLSLI